MRIKNLFSPKKHSRAQTMVEFALVLPILMLLVVGLIEAGRLIFIYGSVTTASREAVRYGSATGDNGSGTPKYLDCAGIEAAAQKMGFLLPIDTVDISYTRDGVEFANCNADLPSASDFKNGDRIEVSTTSNYSTMVPLIPMLLDQPITTSSKRTIFVGVQIIGDAPEPLPVPAITFTKTASKATYTGDGESIAYTFRLENTGEVDFDSYEVTDPRLPSLSCSGGAFAQGAVRTCGPITYTTTSTDLAGGDIVNTATATAFEGTNETSRDATVTVELDAELSLTIAPNPESSTKLGEKIIYTYTLENSGNVILNSPYAVSDDTATSNNCASLGGSLNPGGTVTCEGTYTLTQADLDAGKVTSHATATSDGGTVTSDPASAEVITKPLILSKTADTVLYDVLDQEITYTYTLENVGATDISSFSVEDDKVDLLGSVDCTGATDPLTPGQTTSCEGVYLITQDDLDFGSVTNIALATATDSSGPVTSNEATLEIGADQLPALSLEASVEPTSLTPPDPMPGEIDVEYTYTITNEGNVTLDATTYEILENNNAICTDTFTLLAPDDSATCVSTYRITQADWDAGSITSTVIATTDYIKADITTETVLSNEVTVILITWDEPRLTLEKTANVTEAEGGDYISYTYTLTNTGNVPLYGDYTLTDDIAGAVDCTGINHIVLDLGDSVTRSKYYRVDGDDVNLDSDKIVNKANATAKDADGNTIPSNEAEFTLTYIPPAPPPLCAGWSWINTAYYLSNDIVMYNNHHWSATLANRGQEPGTGTGYWTDDGECKDPLTTPPKCTAPDWLWNKTYPATSLWVNYNGAEWAALETTRDNAPGSIDRYWHYLNPCTP